MDCEDMLYMEQTHERSLVLAALNFRVLLSEY